MLPGRAGLHFRMAPLRPRRNISAHIPVCVSVIMWGKEATAPPPPVQPLWQIQHDGRQAKMTATLYLTGLVAVFI